MKLRKLNKTKDLEQINQLLKQYDWEPWDSDLYGKYYYVITDKDKIVLFGGIYLYDVKVYGRLGLIIGNRSSSKEDRTKAMDMLFTKLFDICEKNKVKGIEYATGNVVMVEKLEKYGFKRHTKQDADMMYRDFGNNDMSFVSE